MQRPGRCKTLDDVLRHLKFCWLVSKLNPLVIRLLLCWLRWLFLNKMVELREHEWAALLASFTRLLRLFKFEVHEFLMWPIVVEVDSLFASPALCCCSMICLKLLVLDWNRVLTTSSGLVRSVPVEPASLVNVFSK